MNFVKKKKKDNLYLAMDLGSRNVKFVEGSYEDGKVRVGSVFMKTVPDEAYMNGAINFDYGLDGTISTAINESGIKTRDLICTVESMDLIKREILVPQLSHEDTMEMIAYEISQYLPINVENYVMQYKVIGEVVEDNIKKNNVLVGAMPKDIAEGVLKLVGSANLHPHFLDIHSNSLEKLFDENTSVNSGYKLGGKTIALLDMGHSFINVTILEKGVYKFNRVIRAGGSFLEDIMKENNTEDSEKGKLEYRDMSIVNLARDYDLSGTSGFGINLDKGSIESNFISNINSWADEIDKVLRYYTSRSIDNKIDNIYIYGGTSMFEDMDSYLEQRLGIKTEKIKSIDKVKFEDKNMEKELPMYINALGSLIRR